jgi:hypothetical protein
MLIVVATYDIALRETGIAILDTLWRSVPGVTSACRRARDRSSQDSRTSIAAGDARRIRFTVMTNGMSITNGPGGIGQADNVRMPV